MSQNESTRGSKHDLLNNTGSQTYLKPECFFLALLNLFVSYFAVIL